MADLDLTGDIALAINGAAEHGATLVLGYVTDDGAPALSFRGSLQVLSADTLGLWARTPDKGLALAAQTPREVSLLYYSGTTPGPAYLSIRGRIRVAPELNDAVYAGMIEAERGQDPDRRGIALAIDVDLVEGAGAEGGFRQERAA